MKAVCSLEQQWPTGAPRTPGGPGGLEVGEHCSRARQPEPMPPEARPRLLFPARRWALTAGSSGAKKILPHVDRLLEAGAHKLLL